MNDPDSCAMKVKEQGKKSFLGSVLLFHDGVSYHIETSPLICSANWWTGFCMIETSVLKELIQKSFMMASVQSQLTVKMHQRKGIDNKCFKNFAFYIRFESVAYYLLWQSLNSKSTTEKRFSITPKHL